MNDDSCLNFNALHNLEKKSTSSDQRSLYHNDEQNNFYYKFLNENKKNNDLDSNSVFQSLTKEIARLKDRIESLNKEKNGLKQQCKAAIQQWDKTLRENNETKDQLIHTTQQRDDALKKVNHEISQRLKTAKDLARLTEERNRAVHEHNLIMSEYNLIMSERDNVHKEMEKLNEELMQYQKRIKSLDQEKKNLLDEIENLKREINNSKLKAMDKEFFMRQVYKERKERIDYQEYSGLKSINSSMTNNKWASSSSGFSSGKTNYSNFKNPISLSSTNSNMNSNFNFDFKSKYQVNSNANSKSELLSENELELRKQIQSLEYEHNDMHFRYQKLLMEKEKVAQERESIKILCDKLRRERDRAIRERAETIQDLNDFKLKIESNAQIKKYMDDLNNLNNLTETTKNIQPNNTSSKDSAISADFNQDNDYELLNISLINNFRHRNGFKNAWGFSVRSQQQDNKCIVISGINLDSPAEEKLKLNDIILSINSISVNDEKLCNELLCKFDKDLQLVIQRKKQLSSILNINLDCCKHEHGLIVENAFLIKKLLPDSVASRNENISVGDRLLSINGNSLENSSIHDVMQLLREDNLLLKVYKQSLNNQNLSTSIVLNQNNYNNFTSNNNYYETNQNELNYNRLFSNNNSKQIYQKDDLHLTNLSTSNKLNYSPNIGHYQSIKRSSKKSKFYLLNDSSSSFQMENDKSTLLELKKMSKKFKKNTELDKKEDYRVFYLNKTENRKKEQMNQ
jgi:hypothetical protein